MVRPGRFKFVNSIISDEELKKEVSEIMGGDDREAVLREVEKETHDLEIGGIVTGIVRSMIGDDALVDINYKSEGRVSLHEFDDGEEVKIGDKVEVLVEDLDEEIGVLKLSKRKADRLRGWERIMDEHDVGDVVTGRPIRKVKGGLLVDIGVPVFLPASQIDIRRTADIGEYIGREHQFKIIKVDRDRRNIVLSRRKLLEEERERKKAEVLASLVKGEIRTGVVKNITDFGAFVDLGGIDGLLHITDMSWGRINHPSEVVSIEQELEVKVLDYDLERERISLGLKQVTPSPWEDIDEKYPVGTRLQGEVVNVMPYGVFVKLEDGIEGLVHISEMSWTRQVSHPSELVNIGDMVDVVVLDINKPKQELSLGMKQTEDNPWDKVAEKYPLGTIVNGKVRNMTNYGAFIELEEGIDGLLHVSDMSWTKKVSHPSSLLKKGETIEAMVLSVDQERKRVALGIKQLEEDPWETKILTKYHTGDIITGVVTKLTNFGAFVEIEDELEALLHISELADHKVDKPEEVVKVGDKVTVMIINIDSRDRKIGLSLRACKGLQDIEPGEEEAPAEEAPTEEAPTEEAPTEEAPAEEAAAEQAPAGEGEQAGEVPSEQVQAETAEEAPAEESQPEQAAGEGEQQG